MKTRTALGFSVLFMAVCVLAQAQTKTTPAHFAQITTTNPVISDDGKEVIEPFNGTYRFIFTKGIKQVFSDEIFKTIEQNRKEEEEVTVTLSPYCKLNILSKKQISQPGFVPFSKSYIFEKSD